MHILKSQLSGFTCKTESNLTQPNCIQVKTKCDLILYDDPERRIVVIIRLLKQEGILCTNSYKGIVLGYVKRAHSDGSSPVTTTPFIVSFFSYTTGFISMQVYRFVRIDIPFL